MMSRYNSRGYKENVVDKRHMKVSDLKEEARHLGNQYLIKKNIPPSPQPEFHGSHLRHDTDKVGLEGIREDSGFKNPYFGHKNPGDGIQDPFRGSLMWWSLVVGPDEIRSAERRLLESTYPDRTEEQTQMQKSFLGEFTTSPAFLKTSRLGSYRFTFPLEELLTAYSEQFCSGAQPVMRVLETVLYKQEVMYVVVVHSPENQGKFSDCPLLTDDDPNAVCTYKDGCFIWRAQAMCGTHSYELVLRPEEKQMEAKLVWSSPQFYVWDNVAVALHVENKVLNFDSTRLRENLKFCRAGKAGLINGYFTFDDFPKAEENVKRLWPDDPAPLKEDE